MLMKNHGFTLLELMITLAIMAIMLSWAVPGFQEIIRQNRLTTETNELVTALNLARSEAIKRGRPVTVTADGGGWGAGFTVATTDADGNAVTLFSGEGVRGNLSISGTQDSFTFSASGFKSGAGEATFEICDPNSAYDRELKVSPIGRPSITPDPDRNFKC